MKINFEKIIIYTILIFIALTIIVPYLTNISEMQQIGIYSISRDLFILALIFFYHHKK